MNIISTAIVDGMIRNITLREIRATYISQLVKNGWKIHNPGQDSCDRWIKEGKKIHHAEKMLLIIISKPFIPSDIRNEFYSMITE